MLNKNLGNKNIRTNSNFLNRSYRNAYRVIFQAWFKDKFKSPRRQLLNKIFDFVGYKKKRTKSDTAFYINHWSLATVVKQEGQ